MTNVDECSCESTTVSRGIEPMDCAPPSCPSICLRLLQIVSAVITQSTLLVAVCGQNKLLNNDKIGQSEYTEGKSNIKF